MSFTNFKKQTGSDIMKRIIAPHTNKSTIKEFLEANTHVAVFALGQGGGRIGSEFAELGYPTYAFNSSQADMNSLRNVPKSNQIHLPYVNQQGEIQDGIEGAGKDHRVGSYLFEVNGNAIFEEFFESREMEVIDNPQFYWVSASLGGGTGSGSFKHVVTTIATARRDYEYEKGNVRLHNFIGAILALPQETGFEYVRNTCEVITDLQETLFEQDENYESIGNVVLIDNNYFKNSDIYLDYEANFNSNADSLEVSNAYAAALITELQSIVGYDSTITVDTAELYKVFGTPGYLHFLHEVENEEMYKKLQSVTGLKGVDLDVENNISTEESMDNVDLQAYDKVLDSITDEILNKPSILTGDMVFNKPPADTGEAMLIGVVYPEDLSKTVLVDLIERIKSKVPTMSSHYSLMPGKKDLQKGITITIGYVTSVRPKRISDMFDLYKAHNERNSARLAAKKELKDKRKDELKIERQELNLFGTPSARKSNVSNPEVEVKPAEVQRKRRNPFANNPNSVRRKVTMESENEVLDDLMGKYHNNK